MLLQLPSYLPHPLRTPHFPLFPSPRYLPQCTADLLSENPHQPLNSPVGLDDVTQLARTEPVWHTGSPLVKACVELPPVAEDTKSWGSSGSYATWDRGHEVAPPARTPHTCGWVRTESDKLAERATTGGGRMEKGGVSSGFGVGVGHAETDAGDRLGVLGGGGAADAATGMLG